MYKLGQCANAGQPGYRRRQCPAPIRMLSAGPDMERQIRANIQQE